MREKSGIVSVCVSRVLLFGSWWVSAEGLGRLLLRQASCICFSLQTPMQCTIYKVRNKTSLHPLLVRPVTQHSICQAIAEFLCWQQVGGRILIIRVLEKNQCVGLFVCMIMHLCMYMNSTTTLGRAIKTYCMCACSVCVCVSVWYTHIYRQLLGWLGWIHQERTAAGLLIYPNTACNTVHSYASQVGLGLKNSHCHHNSTVHT